MKIIRLIILVIALVSFFQCTPPQTIPTETESQDLFTSSQEQLIQSVDNLRNSPVSPDLIQDLIRYDIIDSHALAAPKELIASTTSLAEYLTRPAQNDFEKARAIFRWITENIDYDIEGYLSGATPNSTPEFVLAFGKSVCAGYATLFAELAGLSNLPVLIVNGYAKGANYEPGQKISEKSNHSWNAVKLENNWYLVDCTWGAGILEEQKFIPRFNDFYFLTPAAQIVYTHLPMLSRLQLLPNPISKDDFEQMPKVRPNYFKYGIELVSHPHCIIQCQKELCVKLKVPDEIHITAGISKDNQKIEDNWILVQKENDIFNINARFPDKGDFFLSIYARDHSHSQVKYPQLVKYLVQVEEPLSKTELFPYSYSVFNRGKAFLYTPVGGILKAGNNYQFLLQVIGATEVRIKTRNSFITLTKKNAMFEGQIVVPSGDVIVMARYDEGNQYQYLLKYQTYE